jgi:hypothetical protein
MRRVDCVAIILCSVIIVCDAFSAKSNSLLNNKHSRETDIVLKPGDSLKWGIYIGAQVSTLSEGNFLFPDDNDHGFISNCRFVPVLGFSLMTRNKDIHQLKVSALPYIGRHYYCYSWNGYETMVRQYQVSLDYSFDILLARKTHENKPCIKPYLGLDAGYLNAYYLCNAYRGGAGSYGIINRVSHSNLAFFRLTPSLKYFRRHSGISMTFTLNLLNLTWYNDIIKRTEWSDNTYASRVWTESHEGGLQVLNIGKLIKGGLFTSGIEISYVYMFNK